VEQKQPHVPDPSATLPFRRGGDGSLEPTEPTPSPTPVRRRVGPPKSQFSAVSFALGLFAGITLTSAVAGLVFGVMMLFG